MSYKVPSPPTQIRWIDLKLPADANFVANGIVDFDTIVDQDFIAAWVVSGAGIVTPPKGIYRVTAAMKGTGLTISSQDFQINVDAAGGTPGTAIGPLGLVHPTNLASANSALPIVMTEQTFDGVMTCAVKQGATATGVWTAATCYFRFDEIGTS